MAIGLNNRLIGSIIPIWNIIREEHNMENKLRKLLAEGKGSVATRISSPWATMMEAAASTEQFDYLEFLADEYNDYNLVIALDNGNPCESRIVRKRFDRLCAENGFEKVVFHSLRHLSTKYKLKMTGGDIKTIQAIPKQK